MKATGRKYALRSVAVLGTLVILSGCAIASTQPDDTAVHYDAGTFTSTKFEDCVPNGTRVVNGPEDRHYYYPTGQQKFDFTGEKGAEWNPIPIVSSDNVEMTVPGVAYFDLITDCSTLQKFHEQIGIKFQAYMNTDGDEHVTSGGWDEMLRVYVGQQIKRAMNDSAQPYSWLSIYNNAKIKAEWEKKVSDQIPGLVKAKTGTLYFKNFQFTIQKPQPPAGLKNSLVAAQQAIQDKQTILNRNAAVTSELEQIRALVKELGPYGYVLYRAMLRCEDDDPKTECPSIMPVPAGTNINVPAK